MSDPIDDCVRRFVNDLKAIIRDAAIGALLERFPEPEEAPRPAPKRRKKPAAKKAVKKGRRR